jgi:hypothetical protein
MVGQERGSPFGMALLGPGIAIRLQRSHDVDTPRDRSLIAKLGYGQIFKRGLSCLHSTRGIYTFILFVVIPNIE